eukprot:GHVO01019678.1.p1 GENE.GHVO01019678.1~~GHVO01019678.1.p1  ORF type:complete len:186 (+),score=33.86 GHVO01019678.1:28-558(+)
MRPLTDEEVEAVYKKLSNFVEGNMQRLISKKVLRFHRERVYLVDLHISKMAICVPRKKLMLAGTFIGKFTKSKQFRLQITALELMSRYAKHKVWVNDAGEKSFTYGNSVIKRHLRRMTESIEKNTAVVVYTLEDIPIGFGVAAYSTTGMMGINTEAITIHHQADVGEYLRHESEVI